MLRRILDPDLWRASFEMLAQVLRSVIDPRVWRLALRNVGRSGRRTAIVVTAENEHRLRRFPNDPENLPLPNTPIAPR